MTRKECAEVLQAIKFLLDSGDYSDRVEEALDMAISLMEIEE